MYTCVYVHIYIYRERDITYLIYCYSACGFSHDWFDSIVTPVS